MRWYRYALGLVVLAGCGGGGGNNNNNGSGGAKLKAKLDLTHVIGFAIVPGPAARLPADPCMPSTLYALQDDGSMAVTTVTETTDMNGSASCSTANMSERASAIFDTPYFVIVGYEGLNVNCTSDGHCDMCSYVVARKSDGALFCGSTSTNMVPNDVKGGGTKLYVRQGAQLQRLDTSVDPPTVTAVNDPSMESVEVYDVNAADDVLATGSFGTRIFKANGGLMNISVDRPIASWLNPADGQFYYGPTHQVPNSGGLNLLDVTQLASSTYAPTTVSEFIPANGWKPQISLATASQVYSWLNAPTSGMIVELLPSAAGGVCKRVGANNLSCSSDTDCGSTATCTFNAGCGCMACNGGFHNGGMCASDAECQDTCNGPGGANHVLTGVNVIKNMLGTGTTLYVQGTDTAGNGMIVSVDTSTIGETTCQTPVPVGACNFGCCSSAITPTTLLPAGDYTITATSLSKTGELTFAGLRNSDGAHVVGNCVGGTCSVLNATAPTVMALQRIN